MNMDDGLHLNSSRSNSPGHDIGPDEDRPGYITRYAYFGGENNPFTEVYVPQHRAALFQQEPLDESTEVEPSTDVMPNGRRYFLERERLKTFVRWKSYYPVNPIDLARNGFIHIGPDDQVLCVFCLKTIREWEKGDVVDKEHRRIHPHCPFIQGKCHEVNVPISQLENLRHDLHVKQKGANGLFPAFANETIRRETFVNWPVNLTNIPSPNALAEAGFFYKPQAGKVDRVKCFMCGKVLHQWQPSDNPWVEHAKLSPKCAFVRQRKGTEFVEHCSGQIPMQPGMASANPQGASYLVQSPPEESPKYTRFQGASSSLQSPVQVEDVTQNTAVQAVMQDFGEDFSLEQISRAMEHLQIMNGPGQPVTAEQLVSNLFSQENEMGENMLGPSQPVTAENEEMYNENVLLGLYEGSEITLNNDEDISMQ